MHIYIYCLKVLIPFHTLKFLISLCMKNRYLFILFLNFLFGIPVFSQKAFVHPGILLNSADIKRVYNTVKDKKMPGYGSYLLLSENPLSKADYKMQGPFSTISRDGEFRYTKQKMEADFSAAYLNALMYVATRKNEHAERSLDILTNYADVLKHIPSTNDAPLLVGLEGLKIINVLELLKYTYPGASKTKLNKIGKLFTDVFLPICEKFYETPAYTNGNWGPIVTKCYISAAIYFDNRAMYNKAKAFYEKANDNGTIANYIDGETGQIQESGRDQGHSQLGIGALATVCEIAWKQGDDLYGLLSNRLLKGYEYVAAYNLGNTVPFRKWTDITGRYNDWSVISDKSRGNFIPVYEMAYNHFVLRKGLEMPYTKLVIEKKRPEGYDRDQPGFGTLLYYQSK